MTPKTITEINIVCAELCGWTNIHESLPSVPIPFGKTKLVGTNDGCPECEDTLGHELKSLPNYYEDANTKEEILAHLDQLELMEVIKLLQDGSVYFDIYTAMTCLQANQSFVARAVIKVKGLWKGEWDL